MFQRGSERAKEFMSRICQIDGKGPSVGRLQQSEGKICRESQMLGDDFLNVCIGGIWHWWNLVVR